MAELEGLYLGMGIDTSQLDSDFVDAEKTISENISRINREMQLVQIRGQIELNGLNESAESIEKLKIQEEALMAQMGLQQDKIVLLSAAYEKLSETRGANAKSTQQVEMQLAREQLALQKLEQQMEDLSEQEKIAFDVNLEMLALIEPAITAIDSAVAAGTAMPIPHAKVAAAALIGLGAVAEGTREATKEMRGNNPAKVLDEDFQEAAVSIDESWQQAVDSTHDAIAEMETSVNEAEESLSDMKILPEFDTDSLIEAIELLESESLGESLRKANDLIAESDSLIGKLAASVLGLGTVFSQIDEPIIEFAQTAIENFKELKQVANELNLSIPKASDLVSKINLSGADYNDVRDFVRGVQDAVIKGDSEDPEVLALERYGVAIQDAHGKLLAFDETLDRLYQGYLKAREAGEAEAYIIMTNGQAVQDVLPYFENLARTEEDMAKIKWSTIDIATLQEALRDSKLLETQMDEFKNALSSLAAPAADIALKNAFEIFKTGTELIEENREAVIYWSFVLMEGTNAITGFAKEIGDTAKNKILEFTDSLKKLEKEFGIIDTLKSFLPEEWLEAPDENSIFSRAQKRLEDYIGANEKARQEIKKTAEEVSGLSYSLNRIAKYKSELEGLTLDKQFGSGESYRKSLGEINLWREEALAGAKQYADEQAAIEELYSAKLEQIDQERADKIAEIRKSVDAEFQTSLEQRLAKIEEEKEAWISAGMEEAEASELAQKRIAKAHEEAAAKAQEYFKNAADIEYSLTHTAFEKQLRDIERWEEALRKKAETEKEVAAIAKESAAKAAEAFENAVDRIKGKLQTLDDKIFEIDHSQYENDLRKIQQEYISTATDLQKEGVFDATTKAQLDYLYSRQKANLDKKAQESISTDGDYTKLPEGAMRSSGNGIVVIEGDQIIDAGSTQSRQQAISLITDENQIRAKLIQNIDTEAQTIAARIQATDLQNLLAQPAQQAVSGFEIIAGDNVVTMPQLSMPSFNTALTELQPTASGETTIAFESVVTPLNNITGLVNQIVEALNNREPPSVTVSPNLDIDLGGAYVFDNTMKQTLVNEITNEIVTAITDAVQQATSTTNFGYSA